ncbi:hypothetical protein Esti_002917 [Eimeria stiedai]
MRDVEQQAAAPPWAQWDDDGARDTTSRSFTIRVSVHLVCGACLAAFALWGVMAEPPIRGFFCNDTSIRLPLKPETVPASLALVLVVGLPLIVFAVGEALHALVFDCRARQSVELQCCVVPKAALDMYVVCGGFLFGLLTNCALADVAKITVGRLRPHFLSVCEPNWAAVSCSDSQGSLFVENYQCQGPDAEAIREARLSFFSAHSSNALCGMLYAAVYLQCRLRRQRRGCHCNSRLLWLWEAAAAACAFIQLALLLLALFIALSRVADYFHHPTDVMAGLLVGGLVGLYAALGVSRLHRL